MSNYSYDRDGVCQICALYYETLVFCDLCCVRMCEACFGVYINKFSEYEFNVYHAAPHMLQGVACILCLVGDL